MSQKLQEASKLYPDIIREIQNGYQAIEFMSQGNINQVQCLEKIIKVMEKVNKQQIAIAESIKNELLDRILKNPDKNGVIKPQILEAREKQEYKTRKDALRYTEHLVYDLLLVDYYKTAKDIEALAIHREIKYRCVKCQYEDTKKGNVIEWNCPKCGGRMRAIVQVS